MSEFSLMAIALGGAFGSVSRFLVAQEMGRRFGDFLPYGTLAVNVIENLGHSLGAAIAIVINLFNPEKILIGGVINQAKKVLYPAIQTCIEQQSLPAYHQALEIVESRFYKQATMPGAALIKQALYDGLLLMRVIEG